MTTQLMFQDAPELPLALSGQEQASLERCEQIIAAGLQTFYAVGHALVLIKQAKLYRATHRTFEEYCREKWNISRPRAYQLIDAAGVADNLSTIVDIQPANEAQARALKAAPPDRQADIWEKAVDASGGEQPTATQIKEIVQMEFPREPEPEETEPPHQMQIVHTVDMPQKPPEDRLTFEIMFDMTQDCRVLKKSIRINDIGKNMPFLDDIAEQKGWCQKCEYAYSEHYLEEESQSEVQDAKDIYYECFMCNTVTKFAYHTRDHHDWLRAICRECASKALHTLLDTDPSVIEECKMLSQPFAFYQSDRLKILRAGLRIFRINEMHLEMRELLLLPGNMATGWNLVQRFESKTLLKKRMAELSQDDHIIFDNHL